MSRQLVLIVEDDAQIRELLAAILSEHGYHVVLACNGREALDFLLATSTLPCAILLDLMMPVMSGDELLEALSQHRCLTPIPIIITSTSSSRAKCSNATWTLRKPFTPSELLLTLHECCTLVKQAQA